MTQTKPKGTLKAGLQKVKAQYGSDFAKDIERAIRLETAHMTSGQWLKCGTAGMVKPKNASRTFPFGWNSLDEFAQKKGLKPEQFGLVDFAKTSEGAKTYIRFPETGLFAEFFAWFIQTKRAGIIGKWYRTNMADALAYEEKFRNINATLV